MLCGFLLFPCQNWDMNPYLLPVLEHGPATLLRMLNQIEPHRLDEALSPDRFTPREAVAHLADWEPILLGRIRTAVENPGTSITAYDEGKRAAEMGYKTKNPSAEAALFIEERKRTADYLKGLKTEDWSKTVVHPERGILNVYDLANMLIGHDMYHLEHLSQYLGDKTAGTW